MRTSIGLAVAASTLIACGSPAVTQAPRATSTERRAPPAPTRAIDASPSITVEGPPRATRCRLSVTSAEGCQPSQVEQLVEPARPRIEHCRGASGGKLRVRVTRPATGKLSFDAEPGTSIDPREKQCVLEALNALQEDEASTAWHGPTVRPTGFTSILTIEW